MGAHENAICEARRRGEHGQVYGLIRGACMRPVPADVTDGGIARHLIAYAQMSGWAAHRHVQVSRVFRADVLVGSAVAVLIRTAPRPGSLRELLEQACADDRPSGIVVVSALAQHRRIPSQIGTVPIAFVPLNLLDPADPVEV